MTPGTQLGPYQLLTQIGEGGMGVVYRARDTRLGRDVAIKTLPEQLITDQSRLQRFVQEARLLASLNHPNIVSVFDVGENYLVSELIEGSTLRGAELSLSKILDIGAQIAEGLAAAHALGIAHRDLKPDNVMLVKDGRAKILDFGLARQTFHANPNPDGKTETAAITDPGTIMGTVGYMSPEQVRGGTADSRSDIFSLGVLLHELISGAKPFHRETAAETMAAILKNDPPPLPPGTPPGVVRSILRCLAKAPEERWQSARDLADQLRWLSGAGSSSSAGSPSGPLPSPRRWREVVAWSVAALALLAAVGLLVFRPRQPVLELPVIRAELNLQRPETEVRNPILSPDGSMIAYASVSKEGQAMWIRRLDSPAATKVSGSDGALNVIWSPDSRHVAFITGGKLKRAPVGGGLPQELAADAFGVSAWTPGDLIFYNKTGSAWTSVAILANGTPGPLMASTSSITALLPDGRHYLESQMAAPNAGTGVVSLDGRPVKRLLTWPRTRYVTSAESGSDGPGWLLFLQDRTLMARSFDPAKLDFTGEAIPLAEEVMDFSAAPSVLAYQTGSTSSRAIWVNRMGVEIGTAWEGLGLVFGPALSRDGRSLAVHRRDLVGQVSDDIWVFDLSRKSDSRLTFSKEWEGSPVWSSDEKTVYYVRREDNFSSIRRNTSGSEQVLFKNPNPTLHDVSPDDRFLLFGIDNDLWVLPLRPEGPAYPLARTEFVERRAHFSPDGKWIAYESNETGEFRVYVRPFPATAARYQVSLRGGSQPLWSADGRELFYRDGDGVWSAAVQSLNGEFRASPAKLLFADSRFQLSFSMGQDYAIHPDGKRFLFTRHVHQTKPVQLVLNWQQELKRKK